MNLQKYFVFYEPKKLNLLLSLFLLLKELPVRWSRCFTLFNPPLNFFSWQINLSVRLSNLTSLYLGWKYFSAFRSILQHFVCRIKLRNFDAVYFLEKIEIRSEFNFEIWREIRIIFARCGRDARPVGVLGRRGRAGCASNINPLEKFPNNFPRHFAPRETVTSEGWDL